jgi:Cof subfamily protein (haloacid dehalogenase superfamily)
LFFVASQEKLWYDGIIFRKAGSPMKQPKIIFFDIDGTLIALDSQGISERTIEALSRLKAKGTKICIATGRSPVCLPDFCGMEFDCYLTFNGSLCYGPEGVIFSNPIPRDDVKRILRNTAAMGRPVSVATKSRLAANGIDRDLADYYAIAHLELTVAEDFQEACREEVYQIMLGCRESDYSTILDGVAGTKITASWDRAADVIPKNGGKGTGVRQVLAHFGLSKEDAMAFGDGNNDIELLESVGTGVAMENASERLKAVSNLVCGPVSQDGIYHFLLEHGLI